MRLRPSPHSSMTCLMSSLPENNVMFPRSQQIHIHETKKYVTWPFHIIRIIYWFGCGEEMERGYGNNISPKLGWQSSALPPMTNGFRSSSTLSTLTKTVSWKCHWAITMVTVERERSKLKSIIYGSCLTPSGNALLISSRDSCDLRIGYIMGMYMFWQK